MSDMNDRVQQLQSRYAYVQQFLSEAYEVLRNDRADPPIQPGIRLKEGWRNDNIHISDVAPTDPEAGHTWDIWLQVPDMTANGWVQATAVFVRLP